MSKTPFKTLKVIGSVGEPINEAWHWYNDHVGQKSVRLLIHGGKPRNHDLSIAFVTLLNQLMQPTVGIQPVLMDENRNEIEGNQVVEVCVLNFHGLGLLNNWGDHQR
jgi:acetyl-CoA synthetase